MSASENSPEHEERLCKFAFIAYKRFRQEPFDKESISKDYKAIRPRFENGADFRHGLVLAGACGLTIEQVAGVYYENDNKDNH
jgi:hypothetical protein